MIPKTAPAGQAVFPALRDLPSPDDDATSTMRRLAAQPIGRRGFMAGIVRATACVAAGGLASILPIQESYASTPDPARPGTPLDALVPVIKPELALRNANTGETFKGSYFSWSRAGYDPQAIEKLCWFFRDWREKEVATIDPRLFWGLSALSQAARKEGNSGQIIVTSGFRTRRTNSKLEGAVPNSMHLYGRAVDLVIDGVPTADVAKYMRWLQVGGVGHYPGRFVHVDTGRVRNW